MYIVVFFSFSFFDKDEIKEAIEREWKSFEKMKQEFITKSAGVQGSGYGWLAYMKEKDACEIVTTNNQDILLEKHGLIPLICVDVWEHAYYLNYHTKRMDYLKNIWKLINWDCVNKRLREAKIL